MTTIGFIGVGKLGHPVANVMGTKFKVVGYDPNPSTDEKTYTVGTFAEAASQDIVFIAVPTPHDPAYGGETPSMHLPVKDFDYTTVLETLTNINQYVTDKQLVVLISTVLPGTVRNKFAPVFNGDLVYNPYLIAMGTVAEDFVNPEMVIIGTEEVNNPVLDEKVNRLREVYDTICVPGIRYEIGTWEEAEGIKIFYNTFISMKLSFVNMIQDVAMKTGNMNVDVVTGALKRSTQRILGPAYMHAGFGDAGACHPRDNIALRYMAENLDLGYDLFESIMGSREAQAENMAKFIAQYGNEVTIIGKAYKPAVPYVNGSYSLLIGHYLEQMGITVRYYDLNTGDTQWYDSPVYLIGYWENWVENIEFPVDCVIIDPWRKPGTGFIQYGNTRKD